MHLVNNVFATAFAPGLESKEVELDAVREEKLPEVDYANWMLNGKNVRDRAAALAAGIRSLIDSGYRIVDPQSGEIRSAHYGDIAVLSKTNNGVKGIAAALRDASVPWATEQPGLLATPEAVLALACLRRLNDPRDTVASAEILSLADCEDPESWLADRPLRLPQGHVIPYQWQSFDPPDTLAPPTEQDGALQWFKPADSRTDRLPAVVLASAALMRSCKVIETQEVGSRVKLDSALDMTALGNAVHACVAAALSTSGATFDTPAAHRILQGFRVDGAVDSAVLVRQIAALERWIGARWPNCRRHPEMPIEAVLPNGQVVYGRIDPARNRLRLGDHRPQVQSSAEGQVGPRRGRARGTTCDLC